MKSTLIYLKKNWFLIAVLLIAFFFLRQWGTGHFQYKRDMHALSDSIARLDMDYNLSQERLSAAVELTQTALNEANLYRDTLEDIRNRNRNLIQHYENEIDNLRDIPTNALYLDVSRWLNELSFQ